MQPGQAVYAAIVERFGPSVVAQDGSLDRPALARIVFGSDCGPTLHSVRSEESSHLPCCGAVNSTGKNALEELNAIVHPAVIARQLGFTPQYLCDVLKNKRPVSENLALAMGYKRLIVFANNGKRKP